MIRQKRFKKEGRLKFYPYRGDLFAAIKNRSAKTGMYAALICAALILPVKKGAAWDRDNKRLDVFEMPYQQKNIFVDIGDLM